MNKQIPQYPSGSLKNQPPAAKMIVSKSFAERWTNNPNHYREHFKGFCGAIEIKTS